MLTYMIIFLVSWTPYAFVTFVSAFVKGVTISPLGSTIPGACAKSSTIWSTLYFISTDKKIRNLIKTKIFRIEAKESLDSKGKIISLKITLIRKLFFFNILNLNQKMKLRLKCQIIYL